MTQNKTIPLSENRISKYGNTGKYYYLEEDVKEAVRRLIERLEEEYFKEDEFVNPLIAIKEIFGTSLIKEEKQNE